MTERYNSVKRKRINDRLNTVFRKAKELSVYTDSQVAAFIKFPDGKLYEFASNSMQDIMERFHKDTGCHIQDGRPINQDNLQRQQSQPDHPLTDENMQRQQSQPDHPLTDENMQLQRQRSQSDHPLTDENMQHLEAQSDENLQHSSKVVGVAKSDKCRIVDSYTDEELHVWEQLLKQSMISLLDRQNIVASSSGSRGIEEFQFMVVDSGSMGVESSSGPQRRNEIESPTREAQGMDVDTELRLGFSH